ncbi:MAG: trigger factor [Lachnospiraceae bacterium]|nr:trigger factor [Lachnospiraceae bacterium]
MKKNVSERLLVVLMAGLILVTAAACGNKAETPADSAAAPAETAASAETAEGADTADNAADASSIIEKVEYPEAAYLKSINVSDYVKLADYAGATITAERTAVSDEDVEGQIDSILENYGELVEVDRAIEEGDTANIDYVGTRDGVAFDGGSATGFDLEIGSGRFIEGFEEGLIGHKKGDKVSLNLKFPETYFNTDLAGADVVFDVTVNAVKTMQKAELTDEFVAGLGATDNDGNAISTVDDFRAYIRSYMEESEETAYKQAVQGEALQYLMDNSTFAEPLPEEMEKRLEDMIRNVFTSYANMYGMQIEDFMTSVYGSAEGQYEQDIKDAADEYQKQLLIIQALAEQEKIELSDADFEKEMEDQATSSGMTVEEFKDAVDTEALREDLIGEKVLEFLYGKLGK